MREHYCLVTDRGGHLGNALMLIKQMGIQPDSIVTTEGPDVEALRKDYQAVFTVPYLFQWIGKSRIFNPIRLFLQAWVSFQLARKIRPEKVVSLGAANVVLFCYFARLFGARIFHVECMNQVKSPSITGRMLYPICESLFVQWEELLKKYGSKAHYAGWVL